MTEETKKILETFNNQKEISPNFGAEGRHNRRRLCLTVLTGYDLGLDDVFKSKIDRSPQTLADVEKVMKDGYIILPSLLTPEQIAKVDIAVMHYIPIWPF